MYDEAEDENKDEDQVVAGLLGATGLGGNEAEEGGEVEGQEETESAEAEEEFGDGSETEQG